MKKIRNNWNLSDNFFTRPASRTLIIDDMMDECGCGFWMNSTYNCLLINSILRLSSLLIYVSFHVWL